VFKKLYNYLYVHRFINYFLAGSSAFVLDILVLIFFKEFLKLKPTIAVALGQIVVVVYVFYAHKFWSFKSSGNTTRQMKRFIMLLIANYFFSIAWMWLWIDAVGVSWPLGFGVHTVDVAYLILRTLNVIFAVSWNFFLYKFWVYRVVILPDNLAEISQKSE